ncbi:hypothetical protein O7635_17620 [Asanoa sp. WMMD1127]|uniref:hypothetical protein n=1 Tax=Asanoa sp. WMMD1127 TaxID=3016107 RepID=UPI0024179A91|nr:hypothetical protein [Asanoa sp. WMMD1127]MDG4823677.1 hypothetical protein [Asanoa sp. WMMD1127]
MAWFLNPALTRFRTEVDSRWPRRDKTSDGTIGDRAHQATDSDHNPDKDGSVDAWDMDVNGVDVQQVINAALRHESIQYVIYNRRITSRSWGLGSWRAYDGVNPHTGHVHFNTRPSHENSTKPWFAEEDDMTPAQAKQLEVDAWRLDALTFGADSIRSGPRKGEAMWMVRTVKAIANAVSQVDEQVAAQLKKDLAAIDAAVAANRAETAQVDEQVVERLGAVATPEEQARLLRAVLGDRAKEVGLLLAQG